MPGPEESLSVPPSLPQMLPFLPSQVSAPQAPEAARLEQHVPWEGSWDAHKRVFNRSSTSPIPQENGAHSALWPLLHTSESCLEPVSGFFPQW